MATCKNSDLNLFFDYTTRNQTFMQFYNDDEARVTELMPIDTDCKFKCGPGYYMIGSAIRNCLPLSKWDGLQTTCKRKIHSFPFHLIQNFFRRLFLFFYLLFNIFSFFFSIFSLFLLIFLFTKRLPTEILCSGLPAVKFGLYDPSDCTDPKVVHGTNCTLACDPGFDVKGPLVKSCGGKKSGIWSSRSKQPKCIGKLF